jgi:hypothetical protein
MLTVTLFHSRWPPIQLVWIGVFLLAPLSLYFALRTNSANGPRLTLDQYRALDLGEGKPGQILTGTFNLWNTGSQPLEFHLRAGCACSQLEPAEGQIRPGQLQEIQVGIRLRSEGQDENVQILIQTNDPVTPSAEYYIRAACPAPFQISPPAVDFGNVPEGTSPSTTIRVLDPNGNPMKPSPAFRATSSSPTIIVSRSSAPSEELSIVVKLEGPVPRGPFSAHLHLTLTEAYSLEVPVRAHIRGPVTIAPPIVHFTSGSGTPPHQEALLLAWRPDGQLLGKLVHADTPFGLAVEELPEAGAVKRRRIRLSSSGQDLPLNPGQIRLRFADLSEEVRVEIHVTQEHQVEERKPKFDW